MSERRRPAWVIGDVHGCLRELVALEAAVRRRAGDDVRFVLVGDLINRGPDAYGVVEHCRSGVEAGTHAVVAGNHEELMLRSIAAHRPDLFVDAGCAPPEWLETLPRMMARRPKAVELGTTREWAVFQRLVWVAQGGSETLRSYSSDPGHPKTWQLPGAHLRFLAGLPLLWQDDRVVVTHALANHDDLEALRAGEDLSRMQLMRILWGRSMPPVRPDPTRVLVTGHSVLRRVRRHRPKGIVRVDTGAFAGRRLSAYCPATDESISVPSSVMWSPM